MEVFIELHRDNCYGEYVENAETADGLPVCQDNTPLDVENCEYRIKGVYFPEDKNWKSLEMIVSNTKKKCVW